MKNVRVLVADQDPQSLAHLGQVLESARFQVKLVNSGHQAIEEVARFKPDLCVIDPMIPGIDGFTVSQRITRATPSIKVIISTEFYKGDRYRRDARTRYGAAGFLEKPYSDKVLLDTIDEVLQNKVSATMKDDDHTDPSLSDLSTSHAKITDTLPGVATIENEQTVHVTADELEQQLDQMRAEMVLKPETSSGLLDNMDLDALSETDHDVHVEPEPPPPKVEKVPDTLITPSPLTDEKDFRLTAEDIFGSVIDDIESGRTIDHVPGHPDDQTNPNQVPDVAKQDDTDPDQSPNSADSPNFELLELIHENETSETWKARQIGAKGFEQTVAIKRIKEAYVNDAEVNQLFMLQAKTSAALTHQCIAQVHEVGKLEGARFMARDWISGRHLGKIIRIADERDTVLPAHIVAFIGAALAEALHFAHERADLEGRPLSILHLHLTPQSIMISDEGDVKLLGFGMASGSLTTPDTIPMEMLPYISPEHTGIGVPSALSDQFSLACVLYRAVTGVDPYTGTDRNSLLRKVLESAVPSVDMVEPSIPQEFAAIIAKAMNKDPDLRYPDCARLASDLRGFLKHFHVRLEERDLKNYIVSLCRKEVVPKTPPDLPELPTLDSPEEKALQAQVMAPPAYMSHQPTPVPVPAAPEPGPESLAPAPIQAPAPAPPPVAVEPPQRRTQAPRVNPTSKQSSPLGLIAIVLIVAAATIGVLFWQGILPPGGSEETPTTKAGPANPDPTPPAAQPTNDVPPAEAASVPENETTTNVGNEDPVSESLPAESTTSEVDDTPKMPEVDPSLLEGDEDDEEALALKRKREELQRKIEELERLKREETPP